MIEGRKLYFSKVKPLDEDASDCTPEELHGFLKELCDRVAVYNWNNQDGDLNDITVLRTTRSPKQWTSQWNMETIRMKSHMWEDRGAPHNKTSCYIVG